VRPNVRIEIRERGKLQGLREGHNICTEYGRTWLAELIGFLLHGPDTPERSDRVKYMSFGVGGSAQGNPLASAAPVTTLYPAGSDPNATTGNEYNEDFPVSPPIGTLERPVKLSGSTTDPYATAPGTDVWLLSPSSGNFWVTHATTTEATFRGYLSASDLLLGGFFTALPIAEIGLCTDAVAVSENQAYNPVVAYHSFDTIQKTATMELTFIWSLRF
jgi:hypothetical protein